MLFLLKACLVLVVCTSHSVLAFFGEKTKSHACPVVFVLADGVTPGNDSVLDRGVSIRVDRTFTDPWIDETGHGTRMYKQVRDNFSNCVTIFPVKWEYTPEITRLDRFVTQQCLRKHRSKMCVVFSRWRNLPKLSLPVVYSSQALVKMVESVQVEVSTDANGKRKRTYRFTNHK